MGSGKSTVGPLLALRLNRPFHDLDELIEKEQQMTISEIFALRGEPYFRKVETLLLQQLSALPASVIALGGGSFASEANRELIHENGVSVWLRIPLALAEQRCRHIQTRPLARAPEKFQALFRLRQTHYSQARICVDVEGKEPEEIADEILRRLTEVSS
jgi:shikimate kinase